MKWLALILILLCAHTVDAQKNMNFNEALDTMLENNHLIKGERYSVDAAYNQLRAARGLRWPVIDAIGGFVLTQKDVAIDLGGAKGVVTESLKGFINNGVSSGLLTPDVAQLLAEGLKPITSLDWRYTLQKRDFGFIGATLTVPIYMGGRINIANRMAAISLNATTYSLDATESMLLTQLVERYYGVIVARQLCNVRRDIVDAIHRHLSDAEAMEEEGVVAHSVVVYMQYRLAEAERDLQGAMNKLHVAEMALNTTIGAESNVNPVDRIFLCDNIYSIDYYCDMASALNPIICEARLGKQLSEEGVKMARAAILPEVVAMGSGAIYSYQLSDMVPRWSIGIGVRIPIFDGLGKEFRYKAARSEANSVAEEVENAQSDILLLVKKQYFALENSIYNINATRRAIDFAESYYHSASEGFIEGVTSSSDLIDACVEVAVAKTEYLNAVYESCVALARLLEASGLSGTFMQYIEKGKHIDI